MPYHQKNGSLSVGSFWLAHWILFAAACNVAGWLLSAINQLNSVGLIVTIPFFWLLMAGLIGLRRSNAALIFKPARCHRWRRPLPLAFLILATLSLIGGFLYAPNNFDALIYRMPRVCAWLMAERWEWIPTIKNNLNTRSTGFEWCTVPMIALLHTDRLMFLLNFVSFLFLPGLFFGLFRGLGVRNRAAATWMWLLPSGYCFVLQAASIGNDMITAFFAVAAFDFGFRWKRGGGFTCCALALISCAMMTAIKPTTLPLLLPFGILFAGMWKPAWQRLPRTLAVVVFCVFASFLPTALLNIHYCGDWTGAAAEDQKLGSVEPLVGIAGNTINTLAQNIAPPVFPMAGSWNQFIVTLFPEAFLDAMARSFEPGGAKFALTDFVGEEGAAAGTGVTLLLIFALIAAPLTRMHASRRGNSPSPILLVVLFGLALVAYFSRAGMTTVGRHIAPYYPFIWGIGLLGCGHVRVVRSAIWKFGALAAVLSSIVLVIITPSRPLWPAQWFFSKMPADSTSMIIQRARTGYSVYAGRSDGLGPVRDALPAAATYVGLINFSIGPELPLWKPYMHRKIRHIRPTDSVSDLYQQGMTHVVLHTRNFSEVMIQSPERWVQAVGGTITHRIDLKLIAKEPSSEWWVIELRKPAHTRQP